MTFRVFDMSLRSFGLDFADCLRTLLSSLKAYFWRGDV